MTALLDLLFGNPEIHFTVRHNCTYRVANNHRPLRWPALPAAYPLSEPLTATSSPSADGLTSKDLSGTSRRQPSLTDASTYAFAVAGICQTPRTQHEGMSRALRRPSPT